MLASALILGFLFAPLRPRNLAESELPTNEQIALVEEVVPQASSLITPYNMALMNFLFPETNIIPWERDQIYANLFILEEAPEKFFRVNDPLEHRDARLLSFGARDLYPSLARESIFDENFNEEALYALGISESELEAVPNKKRIAESFFSVKGGS